MARYAAGKKSKALCDRCGLKYDYDQLKEQVVNRRPSGLRVCPSCLDVDHPQHRVGEAKISDAQALRHPRPDRVEPASNVVAFGQRYPHTAGTNEFTLMAATMRMASEMTTTPLLVSGSAAASMTSEFTQTAAAEVTQASPSYTTLTVTVASGTNSYGTGNKYYIAGLSGASPTVTLNEGTTYRFDQSDASNSGHPLRLSTTANGTHGGGSEYTTGVTTNGTPGSAGAYTEIAVQSGAPTLYYYCTVHSGMGGTANTP